jgi:fructose-1,6-bisphosphatase II / sedoheptulose-1,7-bisphosphatase
MPADALMTDELAAALARVTSVAAVAAAKVAGRGDEKLADQAAVDAMRTALNALDIDGRIVIGEGERDEAPMLYIGEEVGTRRGPTALPAMSMPALGQHRRPWPRGRCSSATGPCSWAA